MDKRAMTCSVCGTPEQPYYDIDQDEQIWRHLDFWEYKTFLHAPHSRVRCSTCGKVKYALVPWSRFAEHLKSRQGTIEQISEFYSDISCAFLKGTTDTFPHAHQTIDKFHVMKLLGDAVDETRTTNGVSEAINGLIQAAKRRARGYRTTRNLIAMIYMFGAKFDLG